MTNKERVIAAINYAHPDYTPHNVTFTSQMYDRIVEYTGNPDYINTIDNHIDQVELIKPQIKVKSGFFMDEYGVVWNKTGADKDIGVIDHIMIDEPERLRDITIPPVDEAFIRSCMEQLVSGSPDNFRVARIGFSLFERAWTLRGMENLLCDMIAEPEFTDELLDLITQRNLQILDIALQYDIDAMYFGDDWGQQKGLIMGPRAWRRFIKPRLDKLYGRVHASHKYVIQHSCGDIRDIMPDMIELGLNVYQTFQPEIYGYDYAKQIYNKITIWGGISTQRDLPVKTPEQIKQVTRELMAAFPDGGLIAAPTHDVPSDVPPENIIAMLSVLKKD